MSKSLAVFIVATLTATASALDRRQYLTCGAHGKARAKQSFSGREMRIMAHGPTLSRRD